MIEALKESDIRSIMKMANIPFTHILEAADHYFTSSLEFPRLWFYVLSPWGPLLIGPRKRVYEFNWRHTYSDNMSKSLMFKMEVFPQDVTNEVGYFHAYSGADLLKHISEWVIEARKRLPINEVNHEDGTGSGLGKWSAARNDRAVR